MRREVTRDDGRESHNATCFVDIETAATQFAVNLYHFAEGSGPQPNQAPQPNSQIGRCRTDILHEASQSTFDGLTMA